MLLCTVIGSCGEAGSVLGATSAHGMRCDVVQGSQEPFRTGSGNAPINAPEAHSVIPDAGSKECSKCKMTKPLAGFFKDKSKPDGLYSQVSWRPLCSLSGICCRSAFIRPAADAATTEIGRLESSACSACLTQLNSGVALLCTSQ